MPEPVLASEQRRFSEIVVLIAWVMLLSATGCARLEPAERRAPLPTTSLAGPVKRVTGKTTVEEITSSGQVRQYRLHLPEGNSLRQPLPLVINLHGYNSNAEQQEQVSQMSAKSDASSFVVVYPQGLGNPASWHFGSRQEAREDVTFIRDLIHDLQGQLAVDANRVYVTGISNGAEMTYRLGCDLPDAIAAIGLVVGRLSAAAGLRTCSTCASGDFSRDSG